MQLVIGAAALLSSFMADKLFALAPGANQNLLWLAYLSIATYAPAVVLSLGSAWWSFRKGQPVHRTVCLSLTPLVNWLVLLVVSVLLG